MQQPRSTRGATADQGDWPRRGSSHESQSRATSSAEQELLVVESGRRCQRWCSEPLSSSVLHQRRLSRHHKVWDLEDIEHLRTWPALCRSAPVPTGFAATPSAPRAVLRAQGAHTSLLHTTGSSLHISIDCGSVGAGGRRKLQHGGGLCGSGAASASGGLQLGAGPIGCPPLFCSRISQGGA